MISFCAKILLILAALHQMISAGSIPFQTESNIPYHTVDSSSNELHTVAQTSLDENGVIAEEPVREISNTSLGKPQSEAGDSTPASKLEQTVLAIAGTIGGIIFLVFIIIFVILFLLTSLLSVLLFGGTIFISIVITILGIKKWEETKAGRTWEYVQARSKHTHYSSKRMCEWCGTEASDEEVRCRSCDGPVQLVKPHVVTCTWCKCHNQVFVQNDLSCKYCGGDLPSPVPGDPGQQPADPRRDIPKPFVNSVMLWENKETKTGLGFLLISFPFCVALFLSGPAAIFSLGILLFPIIGVRLMSKGLKAGKKKVDSYRYGEAHLGKVTSIDEDTSVSYNESHPIIITYEFQIGSKLFTSESVINSEEKLPFNESERVWVVVHPKKREISALWPPVI